MNNVVVKIVSVAFIAVMAAGIMYSQDELPVDDILLLQDEPDEPISTNTVNSTDAATAFMKAMNQMIMTGNNQPDLEPDSDCEEVITVGEDPIDDVLALDPVEAAHPAANGNDSDKLQDNPLEAGFEKMVEEIFTALGNGLAASLQSPKINNSDQDSPAEELFDINDLPEDDMKIDEESTEGEGE